MLQENLQRCFNLQPIIFESNKAIDFSSSKFTEQANFQEAKWDEANSALRNIAICGAISKNKRKYNDNALNSMLKLTEGTNCYLDHPDIKSGKKHSVKDLIGTLKNPHLAEKKVRADLFLLDSPYKPLIKSIAESNIGNVGMSINAQGKIHKQRDKQGYELIEEITELFSVDLVVEPATVSNLSESQESDAKLQEEIDILTKQRDDLLAEIFELDRTLFIDQKLKTIPEKYISATFKEQLKACETKEEITKLIFDRKSLLASSKPESKEKSDSFGSGLFEQNFENCFGVKLKE